MAQKRMFSLSVTDTDTFLDMSTSAQALYFHLGMHGDDDGFVGSPKKIMRACGCNDDDVKLLAAKGYIILLESGVVVIRDWRLNNYIRKDRYQETIYLRERAQLKIDKAGRYTVGIPDGNQTGAQNSLGQIRLGESPEKTDPPEIQAVQDYIAAQANAKRITIDAEREATSFVDYYTARGWTVNGNPVRDWKALARRWLSKANQFDDKRDKAAREESDEFWGRVPFT